MRVKIRALRAELSSILRCAHQQPVTVVSRGEPVAVIVSVEEFDRLRRVYTKYSQANSAVLASAH